MRATDIEIGEEYVYSSGRDYLKRNYGVYRVRVIEAPVHPWARQYAGFNYSYPVHGKIDERAARNAALVEAVDINFGFKDGRDRVPLAHIRMPWAEYEKLRSQREIEKRLAEHQREAEKTRAFRLNKSLEALGVGLRLQQNDASWKFITAQNSGGALKVAEDLIKRLS